MNESLIEALACPIDYSYPLQLQSSVRLGMKIQEGELLCPSCGSRYEILAGIPRFLRLNQDSLSDIKRKEMEVRDSGYSGLRGRKRYDLDIDRLPELDAIRAALGNCHGLRVLEAGCGVGQMTCAVQTASEVVALDFSWEGLSTFRFEGSAALDLIQGDVSQLPFREKFFDISLSAQVLEHVPSREMRQAFLARLTWALRPGGRLVLTTYNWDRGRQEAGIPKQGFHEKGIFYYCYEAEELREELSAYCEVEAIWGVQAFLPWTYRIVRALGRKNLYWDRLWRRRRIALPYSKLLLAIGRRSSGGE